MWLAILVIVGGQSLSQFAAWTWYLLACLVCHSWVWVCIDHNRRYLACCDLLGNVEGVTEWSVVAHVAREIDVCQAIGQDDQDGPGGWVTQAFGFSKTQAL